MLILGVLLVIFIGLDAQHGGLMLLILRGLAGHLEGSCCSSGGPCCSSWSSCCSFWRSCCWAWRVMFFILELLLLSFGKHFNYLGVLLERLGGGLGELWVAACWAWFLYYSLILQPILIIFFLERLAHLRALDAHLGGSSCSSWGSCC